MLDAKFVAANPELVVEKLKKRNMEVDLQPFLQAEASRKELLAKVEQMKAERNAVSKEIGVLKKNGQDATPIMEKMRALGDEIDALDAQVKKAEETIRTSLLAIPNIPNESVPFGNSDADNPVQRRWGELPQIENPKNHWEVAEELGILDFERAAKISGARFVVYRGLGARLERAVYNFFLDVHTSKTYVEIFPPFMVNSKAMTGTGQLPKFAEDMYHLENTDLYMIPTAEVPVTNMYRDDIIPAEQLPIRYCAYSACFRGEGGSAGRDQRGLIRQHQFNKVELVNFTAPEDSWQQLDNLTHAAEKVLQGLGLPYRVVCLCTGDVGFSSACTYDIEVWMPSYNRYVEISSCSNFLDYQARRANIRCRNADGKPVFAHTLNGSGVAIGRTVAAILENYQNADGTVEVPEALRKYMGVDLIK